MRRVTIGNPDLRNTYKTYLASAYSSGTTLTVLSNVSFAANDLAVVGDVGEELTYAIRNKDSNRLPHEIGGANDFINRHPILEAGMDIGTGVGATYGIAQEFGASSRHINQTISYVVPVEGLIKFVNYIQDSMAYLMGKN